MGKNLPDELVSLMLASIQLRSQQVLILAASSAAKHLVSGSLIYTISPLDNHTLPLAPKRPSLWITQDLANLRHIALGILVYYSSANLLKDKAIIRKAPMAGPQRIAVRTQQTRNNTTRVVEYLSGLAFFFFPFSRSALEG